MRIDLVMNFGSLMFDVIFLKILLLFVYGFFNIASLIPSVFGKLPTPNLVSFTPLQLITRKYIIPTGFLATTCQEWKTIGCLCALLSRINAHICPITLRLCLSSRYAIFSISDH
jgi:hypothetical protein